MIEDEMRCLGTKGCVVLATPEPPPAFVSVQASESSFPHTFSTFRLSVRAEACASLCLAPFTCFRGKHMQLSFFHSHTSNRSQLVSRMNLLNRKSSNGSASIAVSHLCNSQVQVALKMRSLICVFVFTRSPIRFQKYSPKHFSGQQLIHLNTDSLVSSFP